MTPPSKNASSTRSICSMSRPVRKRNCACGSSTAPPRLALGSSAAPPTIAADPQLRVAVWRGIDSHDLGQPRIDQPRDDPQLLDLARSQVCWLVQRQVRGDNRRQPGVEAVVEKLKQLLLGPGGR